MDYKELTTEIDKLPDEQLLGVFIQVVERVAQKPIFVPCGMSETIARIEKKALSKYKDPRKED